MRPRIAMQFRHLSRELIEMHKTRKRLTPGSLFAPFNQLRNDSLYIFLRNGSVMTNQNTRNWINAFGARKVICCNEISAQFADLELD